MYSVAGCSALCPRAKQEQKSVTNSKARLQQEQTTKYSYNNEILFSPCSSRNLSGNSKNKEKRRKHPQNDARKQVTMPDAVQKEVQGCREVKETEEVDLLLQYCEEIFAKVVYILEHVAEEHNAKEWSDIELETGETYVGKNNCEEVAGKEFDVIRLEADMNYDMERSM